FSDLDAEPFRRGQRLPCRLLVLAGCCLSGRRSGTGPRRCPETGEQDAAAGQGGDRDKPSRSRKAVSHCQPLLYLLMTPSETSWWVGLFSKRSIVSGSTMR